MQALLALWDDLRTLPGPHLFVLRGVSMWPAVPDGSILAVHPCETSALRSGDLVTFRQRGSIVTHRVVEVTPSGAVLTWGDSLIAPDPLIAGVDVLGMATLIDRGSILRTAGVRLLARRVGAAMIRTMLGRADKRRTASMGSRG